jgi:regulator of replication initiation timing
MDFDVVLRLEHKIDSLLSQYLEMKGRCQRLEEENRALVEGRARFRDELDRILGKFESLDQEIF